MKKLTFIVVCMWLYTTDLSALAKKAIPRFEYYDVVARKGFGGYHFTYFIDRKYNIICYEGFKEISCVPIQQVGGK